MVKKILTFLMIIMITAVGVCVPAYADPGSSCSPNFLGLKPWYDQLTKSDCSIKDIAPEGGTESADSVKVSTFVLTIAGNVVADILLIIGYVSIAMIIYGGYLYMTSEGDASKAQKARKALTGAIVGTIVGILGSAIVNFIIDILI